MPKFFRKHKLKGEAVQPVQETGVCLAQEVGLAQEVDQVQGVDLARELVVQAQDPVQRAKILLVKEYLL